MAVAHLVFAVCVTALLVGCGPEGSPPPGGERLFVAPATLKLYSELGPTAKVVATAAHGEPADILQRRRSFVKIRTTGGQEGWTQLHNLLDSRQMRALQRLAEQAATLPSHGQASTYGTLNVHTEPNRQAPSFHQLAEGEKVDVLLHRRLPRTRYQAARLTPRPDAGGRKSQGAGDSKEGGRRREAESDVLALPIEIPAPRLPDDWMELSRPAIPATVPAVSEPDAQRAEAAPPQPPDHWVLVRMPGGSAGWVIFSRLIMGIPDTVAQYAEGHQITSYFSLGTVPDQAETKNHWLWTTLSRRGLPLDFDGFRVFVWSLSRHRYETVYIERNVKGHFPVEVQDLAPGEDQRPAATKGFSLILEDKEGRLQRKTYGFQGYRVRVRVQTPWQKSTADPWLEPAGDEPPQQPPEEHSFFERWKNRIKALFRR